MPKREEERTASQLATRGLRIAGIVHTPDLEEAGMGGWWLRVAGGMEEEAGTAITTT